MWKLIFLSLIQSLFLCSGQVLLKYALKAMGAVSMTWEFIGRQLVNWWWLGCGVCFVTAGFLWMYIIKHFPFSVAYPMSSLTYIFGMICAIVLFNEHVSWTQWIGILLIMGGCILIAK